MPGAIGSVSQHALSTPQPCRGAVMRINPRRLPFYVTLFLFALLFGFGSVTYT
ncbi:hypothetical protein GR204_35540, partial [Rhizobium leguminosarum]|nr:hypothetical protein [Rhizobium leguminosarum]